MKNTKSELEQKIQIKEEEMINLGDKKIQIKEEEMINLGGKKRSESKNTKQNTNKTTNHKSKKEIFFFYLFSLFFSLCTSFFSLCYKDEKIILNKGNALNLKIDRSEKMPQFKDQNLIRNFLNYKLKKVNIKRKIFKYNIIIIRYIIIINSFILLILNNNNFLIGSKFANIIKLKIKGTGYNYILSTDTKEYFSEEYYPNITYINDIQKSSISNNYYFDKDDNFVVLIWNNTIDDTSGMFHDCSNITEIDLSNFDTSKVINMAYMFSGCLQLTSLDLSNFNTSNVYNMMSMFSLCSELSSLDLSNFDTSKVIVMADMFGFCTKLSSLDLSNFDTSRVEEMNCMFCGCSELYSLDLSDFDTSKVIYMQYMFQQCSKLNYLNLKNFIENDSLETTDIFEGVSDNIVICLNKNSENILTEVNNKGYNIDCSFDMNNNLKKEIEKYDKFIKNIENIFTSKDYNTTKLDEGKDEIYETEKMKIILTTSSNQKNNINYNITNIDLGECEEELKKFYNLTYNEILYIKKMDIVQEGMRIPKIEYDVYCKLFGKNLIKLNISICNENSIYLYIPVKNIGNLNHLNKSSDYYNDICSTATSESNTDITHKDRQNEYINKTVCQEECDFNDYNYTSQKAKCKCKVKESSFSFFNMNINRTELLNNFKDI